MSISYQQSAKGSASGGTPEGEFSRLVGAVTDCQGDARAVPGNSGVVLGKLVSWSPESGPQVDFPGNPGGPLAALSTVPLHPSHVGSRLALTFVEGDRRQPLVLGKIEEPGRQSTVSVTADEERLELSAQKELVLRCGKASITLTKAGKILLRGAYLLSRSSGVNRIKGGSVQIN